MAVLDYSQQVPAAERTLNLLEALGSAPDGLTSAELLEILDGSRSGLYALLNTLRARQFVTSHDSRHRLGPALWSLLPDRPGDLDRLIEGLAEETAANPIDETVMLTWPDRGTTVVAAESPTDRPLRVVYQPGSRRAPTAPDARLMAAGGPGEAEDLKAIRQSGSATDSDNEVLEIAVPICADGTRPTAALVVGVPIHRADQATADLLQAEVRQMAARLSYRLGALTYQPYGWAATEPVGPTRDLDAAELNQFLDGLWGAQLACLRPDSTPHVVPLWYEWDGRSMWLAASPGSSWRSYIAENPQVSVTLDEPWPPLRRAFLSGTATEVGDDVVPGGVGGLRRRLATRYLGNGADDRAELSEVGGWAAVRITPERIHGRQGLGRPETPT
ncbi:MAG: pyridoxamine 5'-phosphate oxidase family protein [Acidimicrobiia bacterium]